MLRFRLVSLDGIDNNATCRLRQVRLRPEHFGRPAMSSDFPSRLKESRERRGLTQAELGKEAGLPSTTLSHFESGSRKPSFDNLRRLTRVLGVSTDYLMGIVDTPEATGAASRIARHLQNATEDEIQMLEDVAKSLANRRQGGDG